MSGILLVAVSLLTVFCFSGCQSDRITPAPGAPVFSLEKYAAKHWQQIARPVPAFKKTLQDKSLEESEKLLAQYKMTAEKFAPYFEDDCNIIDKALNWPQGTYFKRTYWPLDPAAMKKDKEHECTSWAVMQDLAADNQVFLHKNRDTQIRKSVIVHRHSSKDRYGYLGLHDIGWLDITMGMNSVGLAIAVNSGDNSDGISICGMDTTLLGRIMLEKCKTADEAVSMLKDMVESNAYMHGKYGSIWLLADKDCVYVVEHDAKRFSTQKYVKGAVIRANAWSLPDMIPFSQKNAKGVMNSRQREFAVKKALFDLGTQYDRAVTAEIIAKAARIDSIPELPGKAAGPCGSRTVSAATFSIDREFPADLSTMYAASGNPGYTFFIPVPLTVDNLPDTLLNQKFSADVYKRWAAGKKNISDEKRTEIEKKMNLNHRTAREKARKLLRESFSETNRLEARKIMNKAFAENWKILSPYIEK